MNITCRCRSNAVLDKYDEHLMMCSRTKGHDAAVKEIFRMCNQANITTIMEPEGLKTAIGQTLNRMNITCRCRSNAVLDKYDEHLMMCSRTKGHDAAVKEIFRMCNQANITTIMEPEGLMENNRRPDLVVSNFQNNNKQVLLNFTTISVLCTNVIDNAWKQSDYAAKKETSIV
eukprot:CAMPEP_0204859274 /NCGR_PEP_ID=MMETSP1347-20130617/23599_1 /ASSEMBLY_ACC=CAM_ASM_000690 /TAXON_ID=215587 /ORGANISM="Aplanochytrium stocchinoi, Strain GSBS06" /LENGTH=172 /DNA_ID=CAMNT_0052007715 /DNA_START=272 /DNA_END=790 /DNA_ORIENTATION=-